MRFKELLEATKPTPWQVCKKAAEELEGEYGLATCDEQGMDKIIFIKKADALAKKRFGEFGFSTCKEGEMEDLINDNPSLIRPAIMARFGK